MRIIVTGGRRYNDRATFAQVMEEYADQTPTIVHGGMSGADMWGFLWAREKGFPQETFRADWDAHGRAAGPIRNQEMVDAGADLVIAFPGERGTADCVRRAEAAGIPVRRVAGGTAP